MDGQIVAFQVTKDLTTAQQVVMLPSEEPLQMLTTSAACMQVSRFLESTQKSCQVNGSIKLDHVWLLRLVTTSGCQDTSSTGVQKNTA